MLKESAADSKVNEYAEWRHLHERRLIKWVVVSIIQLYRNTLFCYGIS